MTLLRDGKGMIKATEEQTAHVCRLAGLPRESVLEVWLDTINSGNCSITLKGKAEKVTTTMKVGR